jgi:hypothetical protein
MIPCQRCSPEDEHGNSLPTKVKTTTSLGLKQRGKTKYSPDHIYYERIYVCQDCGAKWKMTGNLGPNPSYQEVPFHEIVKGKN